MNDNSPNKRVINNTIFLSIRMVLILCINLYTTRAVLQNLGVEDYGIYNVVCGFVSMFTFLSTSISNGIQRFFNYEYGKNGVEGAHKVFMTSFAIQLLMILIILLLTESFGLWYINTKMIIPENRVFAANIIFQLSIFSFVLTLLQSPFSASVIAHEHMNFFAIISVFDAALKLLVALFIGYIDRDKLVIYGLLIAAISILDFFAYYIYSKRRYEEIHFSRFFNKNLFRSMLSFSGWNLFGIFADMMREQGLNMILNLFFGPIVNAARAIAYQVSSALKGFIAGASTSARPQIVQSYAQSNIDRSIKLVYGLSKVSMLLYIGIGLPLAFNIDYVLKLWLGPNIPEHTATFVIIVLMISMVNNLNSALSSIVHASGQMKKYQLYGGICSLITIPLAYYILKIGGNAESAFWVCLICTVIMQIVSLIVVKGIIPFSISDYHKKVIFPLTIIGIVSAIIPLFIVKSIPEGFMRLLFITVSVTIIAGLLFYLIGLTKEEKNIVNTYFKK